MYAPKVRWMVFSKSMTTDVQFLCSWPGFFTVECLTKVLEQIWNFQTYPNYELNLYTVNYQTWK